MRNPKLKVSNFEESLNRFLKMLTSDCIFLFRTKNVGPSRSWRCQGLVMLFLFFVTKLLLKKFKIECVFLLLFYLQNAPKTGHW